MAHTIEDELRLEAEKYSSDVSAALNPIGTQPMKEFSSGAGKYFTEWEPSGASSTNIIGGRPQMGAANVTPSAPIIFNPPTMGRATFDEPVMGEMPIFAAPEYDEAEVSKRTQKYAAPGVRKLRGAVQESMTRRSENPNINRMTLRDALAGYGEGLESVMSGASKTATAEYAQQYAIEYKTAGMNYQTAVQTVRDKYQGQMHARSAEFQAEMNALNQVYQGELQAERFRVEEERRTQSFDYMYDQFKKSLISGLTVGGFGQTYSNTYDKSGKALI